MSAQRAPGRHMVAVKCGRCDGKGAIASFTTRYSGKCFACSDSGQRWMSRAAFDKKQALVKEHDAYFAAQRARHPLCKTCGYAMGGAEGYTEKACKCGHTEVAAIAKAIGSAS